MVNKFIVSAVLCCIAAPIHIQASQAHNAYDMMQKLNGEGSLVATAAAAAASSRPIYSTKVDLLRQNPVRLSYLTQQTSYFYSVSMSNQSNLNNDAQARDRQVFIDRIEEWRGSCVLPKCDEFLSPEILDNPDTDKLCKQESVEDLLLEMLDSPHMYNVQMPQLAEPVWKILDNLDTWKSDPKHYNIPSYVLLGEGYCQFLNDYSFPVEQISENHAVGKTSESRDQERFLDLIAQSIRNALIHVETYFQKNNIKYLEEN